MLLVLLQSNSIHQPWSSTTYNLALGTDRRSVGNEQNTTPVPKYFFSLQSTPDKAPMLPCRETHESTLHQHFIQLWNARSIKLEHSCLLSRHWNWFLGVCECEKVLFILEFQTHWFTYYSAIGGYILPWIEPLGLWAKCSIHTISSTSQKYPMNKAVSSPVL